MSEPFTGGCRCGVVRYECTAEPMIAGNCHCRDCQRASGTAMWSAFAVPEDSLTVTGELTSYSVKADSGNTSTRKFCPVCGAPVMAVSSGMPDLAMLVAGSLDDPSVFKPTMDVFTDCAQPWDHMDPDLAKFPGMPEMPG